MIRRWLLLSLSILVVPACSGSASVTTSGSPLAGSPSVGATASIQGNGGNAGPCDTQWYPVSQGASWTYSDAVSGLAKTSFTQTIDTVTSTGFASSSKFTGVTAHSLWSCSSQGVTALDFGGGLAATLTGGSTSASFKTTKATGITYPATISPGDSWQQSFDINGSIPAGPPQSKASGTVSVSSKATGMARMTVPAGSFDALEIDQTIQFSMTLSASGIKVPLTSTFHATQFLAKGVGLVKETFKGSFGPSAINGTSSLTQYSV